MKVVIDVEANALHNPTKVWCIVLKDIDKGDYYVFTELPGVSTNETTAKSLSEFPEFCLGIQSYIGHNILGWDLPTLRALQLGVNIRDDQVLDTLILSKLVDYPRDGHSIEDYGLEFGTEKGIYNDFSKYSEELLEYCRRDVEICEKVYLKFRRYVNDSRHLQSIRTEHAFQLVVNKLSSSGFSYDSRRSTNLLETVQKELETLDKEIADVFRPKLVLVKEVHPRVTQFGTLHRGDFRWCKDLDLSEYNGGPFCRCGWREFNPSSHKQVVDVLSKAGWVPTDKTRAHIDAIRSGEVEPAHLQYGWKINEANLTTLPASAPKPAKTLASRILLESRRRTLTEWNGLVKEDGRIHGKFYSIGAWTHRMSHQSPNTANIPTGNKLYGRQMRSLWRAPRNRLLVGCDAEGIQLRIFAHYIDDREFTDAIVNGKKSDQSDPHSLNQRILGDVCRTRDIAKRYIYALLLGAGMGKLQEILGCTSIEAKTGYNNIIGRYRGLADLKHRVIPSDARRGWFVGLDGRRVRIPGGTPSERRHLCMSGYLQNGEAVIMKMACLKWWARLQEFDAKLVNFVHDEWQTECPNNMAIALTIAQLQADSLCSVGQELGLRCPLAGSYWSDTHKDYSIGTNWSFTH
jgi:DNA polymerase I